MIPRTILTIAISVGCGITVWAQDEKSIHDLTAALIALSPRTVDPREAELLSETAHHSSRECAKEYGVTGDPAVHNYLIHIGVKKRGICADYTHDIGARLRDLRFKTLIIHWGTAWEKESDENNALIVTAQNQSFYEGIVLDGWRRAGRLFWIHVKDDAEYETGRHGFLGHIGGHARTYTTAWKEDPQGTRSLQPQPLPPKSQPKRKAPQRKT
ncbi:MAG TPA: hypothetical protein VLK27_00015 [Chthoniobacterales bacterium]|nr:hypothetical protein [Chthoniobacterales bacterium]